MISPVADVLRNLLSKVNWARAGLGLPLVSSSWAQFLIFPYYLQSLSVLYLYLCAGLFSSVSFDHLNF